jgi:hypothetical protein
MRLHASCDNTLTDVQLLGCAVTLGKTRRYGHLLKQGRSLALVCAELIQNWCFCSMSKDKMAAYVPPHATTLMSITTVTTASSLACGMMFFSSASLNSGVAGSSRPISRKGTRSTTSVCTAYCSTAKHNKHSMVLAQQAGGRQSHGLQLAHGKPISRKGTRSTTSACTASKPGFRVQV